MASKNHKNNLFSTFWKRLKHALSASDKDWSSLHPAAPQAAASQDASHLQARHLERCLAKDSPVEAARKQLDRFWQNTASS